MPAKKLSEKDILIQQKIADEMSIIIKELVDNDIKKNKDKDIPYYKNDLADNIGISRASLYNYMCGSNMKGKNSKPVIPDAANLYKIKKYFNVSYAYLFGESAQVTSDEYEVYFGINYGLDSNAQEELKKLKLDANKKSIEENYLANVKLFIINSMIKNQSLLERMANLLLIGLGQNLWDEELKNEKDYIPYEFDKYTEFIRFDVVQECTFFLNSLCNGNKVPQVIKSYCQKHGLKYAGKRKKFIENYILNNQKIKK